MSERRKRIIDNITHNRGFFSVIVTIFVVQMIFTYLGGSVLRTVPLLPEEWGYIFLASFLIIPIDLLRKVVVKPLIKKNAVVNEKKKKD